MGERGSCLYLRHTHARTHSLTHSTAYTHAYMQTQTHARTHIQRLGARGGGDRDRGQYSAVRSGGRHRYDMAVGDLLVMAVGDLSVNIRRSCLPSLCSNMCMVFLARAIQ